MRIRIAALAAALAALAAAPPALAGPTLPRAQRAAIERLLVRFVPAAVGRHHPADAYALVTPAMRATATRSQWAAGTIPVAPFPVRRARTYGMRVIFAKAGDVEFDLMMQPRRGSGQGPAVYTTEVQKVGGHWRIASIYPAAQFAGPGVAPNIEAQNDLGPHGQGVPRRSTLAAHWILVPIAIAVVPLVGAPLAMLVVWRRSRRRAPDAAALARASAPWHRP
jgi:hypothetical protein